LIKSVLLGLQAHVRKIVVTNIKDDTFYAVIWIEREGQMISIDRGKVMPWRWRWRIDCPIYVDDVVLNSRRIKMRRKRESITRN